MTAVEGSRVVSVIVRVDDPAAFAVEFQPEYQSVNGYLHPEQIDVRAYPSMIALSIDAARALVEQLTRELEKAGKS